MISRITKRPAASRRRWFVPHFVLLILLLAGGHAASAPTVTEVRLPSGFDMSVRTYPADDAQTLLIWLPSKYGIRPGNAGFAQTVRDQGIDFWLVDLHGSYLVPTGRHGFAEFDPLHVAELVDHAVQRGWRNIVLGGESRGAKLAMQAARAWQLAHPGNATLKGLLVFHPYLIDGYTEIGDAARFDPIARTSNLPVYLIQPEFNTKYLHSRQLLAQLESGGAAVYYHPLAGVRGGFHLRGADRLNDRETEERRQLGQRIRRAVGLLNRLTPPARAAAAVADLPAGSDHGAGTDAGLRVLTPAPAPPVEVRDQHGRLVTLADYPGEIVLVNFWASWCGPCVREIASLVRLVDELEDVPFRVLTINVGEDQGYVVDFLDSLDVTPNFEVLFDPDGEAARQWRVYAVPSSYLLDRQRRLRYGFRGALRWDKEGVIRVVRDLLATPDRQVRRGVNDVRQGRSD